MRQSDDNSCNSSFRESLKNTSRSDMFEFIDLLRMLCNPVPLGSDDGD